MSQWLVPTVVAFLAWGVWAFLPKLAVAYISPKSAILYEIIGALVLGVLLLVNLEFKLDTNPKGALYAMATGALGLVGSLAYLYAVVKGPVSVVSMFSALYPIVTIGLAYFFLNEIITVKQSVGIVLAFLAIYLLAS